jgi:hypothetical protein
MLPSTVLTIAGILGLFAALSGALLWVDGEQRATIPSKRLRVVIGAMSVGLLAAGIWLAAEPQGTDASLRTDITKLETANTELKAQVLAGEVRLEDARKQLEAQAERLTEDVRSATLRSVIAIGERGIYGGCDVQRLTAAGPNGLSQMPCEVLASSIWTIEIAISLPTTGPSLEKALEELGLDVYSVPSGTASRGMNETHLGIVFPDATPWRLVCDIHRVVGGRIPLTSTMSASAYRDLTSQPFPSYAIQVGVPISAYANDGTALSSSEWANLCGPDANEDAFEETVRQHVRTFTRKARDERSR